MPNDLAPSVLNQPHIARASVRKRTKTYGLFLVGILAGPNAALAQTVPAPLAELGRCRSIGDPGARLSCFDKASDTILAAQSAGTLLPQPESDRRVLGLTDAVRTGPQPSRAERDRNEVREITTTVASYRPASGRRLWYIRLANAQLWRTLAGMSVEPRVDATVRIRTTVTGGFRMSIGGGTPVQVERVL